MQLMYYALLVLTAVILSVNGDEVSENAKKAAAVELQHINSDLTTLRFTVKFGEKLTEQDKQKTIVLLKRVSEMAKQFKIDADAEKYDGYAEKMDKLKETEYKEAEKIYVPAINGLYPLQKKIAKS